MAYLDNVVAALVKQKGQGIILRSGKRVAMRTEDGQMDLSSVVLTTKQVHDVLNEIVPPQLRAKLEASEGTFDFVYGAPAGNVRLDVSAARGELLVRGVITSAPPTAAESAVATPAPAPAAAPAAATRAPAAAKRDYSDQGELDRYFNQMLDLGASDLHLSSKAPPMVRLHGTMKPLEGVQPLEPEALEKMLMAIMPERNQSEFLENWDTDFAHVVPGRARLRSNIFRDANGTGAVFRQIPIDILSVQDLGLPESVLHFCTLSKGLVLVTGPTGSGKSTTLAAMIDHINDTRTDHIITIEDPVEFTHKNKKCLINHREVGTHSKSFKAALRAALREDPDIVLVGEMRDLETVAIAIETAETGHLVFGTLHTNTAPSTIDRLIDQFPADQQAQIRTMLSTSLKGVVAQTLCKRAQGGRVAALEILVVNAAVANLIREGKTFQIPSLMQTGKGEGMVLLTESLLTLVRKKVITAEEAHNRAADPKEMAAALTRAGYSGSWSA